MSANEPTVSVVIPAYNQADFLVEAIQSVLAQTYNDYEIIIVDDGSTDEMATVAKQFGSAIRYIFQENQGLASARNTGIREALGEYVALLDSDDQWLPNFLETMMALADQHPEAVVYYCGVYYMDGDGHDLPQRMGVQVVPPGAMYANMLRGNFLVPSTIVMRRSTIIEAGMFDPGFRRLQDWEFWLRILKAGHTFSGSSVRLVRYRIHSTSLSEDLRGGQRAAQEMVEKHFGTDDGQYSTWSDEKRRAYGGVYRYQGLMSLTRQGNWSACGKQLGRAFQADPTLAADLDLFYELALGSQPLGYRGTSARLDLERNEEQVKNLLADIFQSSSSRLEELQSKAYGTAHYALGLVAYRMERLSLSRRFLLAAIRFRPDLALGDRRFTATILKSLAGYRGLRWLRQLRHESRRLLRT